MKPASGTRKSMREKPPVDYDDALDDSDDDDVMDVDQVGDGEVRQSP